MKLHLIDIEIILFCSLLNKVKPRLNKDIILLTLPDLVFLVSLIFNLLDN